MPRRPGRPAKDRRAYTDEEIDAALARLKLNGGDVPVTARETGIPGATLSEWQQKAYIAALEARVGELVAYSEKAQQAPDPRLIDWAARWGGAHALALDKVMEQLPNVADPKMAVQLAALVSSTYLDHAVGRRGAGSTPAPTQVNIHNTQQTLSLAAGMDPALKREILTRTLSSMEPSVPALPVPAVVGEGAGE